MKNNIRTATGNRPWLILGVILLVAVGAYVHQHSAKASARGITYSQTSVTTTPSDLLW